MTRTVAVIGVTVLSVSVACAVVCLWGLVTHRIQVMAADERDAIEVQVIDGMTATATPPVWSGWQRIQQPRRRAPIRPLLLTCPPVRDWQPLVCTTVRHERWAQRQLMRIRAEVAV